TIGASATTPAAATTPGSGSIAAVAATILPSVVSIDVHNGASGDTGSGIVISDAGYILTNNHVVSAARSGGKLSVVFPDKQSVPAEIIGRHGQRPCRDPCARRARAASCAARQ